jgi:hypothetical protein
MMSPTVQNIRKAFLKKISDTKQQDTAKQPERQKTA